MRRSRLGLWAAGALAAAAGAASATPLRLDYCVDPLGGGQYRYTFHLVLDNNDGSWTSGQGFGWIIFGDANQATSPINDFVGDPSYFPIGPFTDYQGSGGGHNGPTLGPVVILQPPYPPNLWTPVAVGDSLTWGGTAAEFIPEGQMLWSNLMAGGGAAYANFEAAHLQASCGGGPSGACCLADGSCSVTSSGVCSAAGGIYRGDGSACATANCPQPPTGACCTDDGCTVLTQAQCNAQGGTYHGDNSTCATANCPNNLVCNGGFETGDFRCWTQFGDTSFTGVGTTPHHSGTYAAYFGPTSGNGGIMQTVAVPEHTMLTIDFWYQAQGNTNFFSADLGSTNLVSFTNDTGHTAWTHFSFTVEAPTDGPALSFTFANPPSYDYLDDVHVYAQSTTTCYANCDHSTTVPFLNVNDFVCFQTKFAAGDSYANCDGSTTPPVLNVNDFVCFQTRFAAGCSAP